MDITIIILIICILLLLFIKISVYNKKYTVLRVLDGDTIAIGNKNAKKVPRSRKYRGEKVIRLIGVNAPESQKSFKDIEPYGKESKEWLIKLILNQKVTISYDKQRIDKFNRHLCYVYMGGEMINKMIAYNGMGFVDEVLPNNKHISILRKAENHAKNKKRGLWKIYQSPTKIRKKYKHLDTYNKF